MPGSQKVEYIVLCRPHYRLDLDFENDYHYVSSEPIIRDSFTSHNLCKKRRNPNGYAKVTDNRVGNFDGRTGPVRNSGRAV